MYDRRKVLANLQKILTANYRNRKKRAKSRPKLLISRRLYLQSASVKHYLDLDQEQVMTIRAGRVSFY